MKLRKDLKLLDVFCVATGAMISSGIFVLPGLAYAQAGPAVAVSYFIAGLIASTGMLSIAELVTAMPKAGGDYFFITRSLGPAVGTVSGVLSWFSLIFKTTLALVGIGAFSTLIGWRDGRLLSVLFCLVFLFVNLIGTKEASRLQRGFVFGLMGIMFFYCFRSFGFVNLTRFQPFIPFGWKAVFSTASFVFISYGGLLKVVSIAEEVENPGRNIPLGMILSLLVVGVLYTLVVFVTTGMLSPQEFRVSYTPISDGAFVSMGLWGKALLSLAAVFAFVTTANAGLMAASRYPLALARDGFFPPFLAKINDRFKTPHYALGVTAFFIIVTLFLNFVFLVKVASAILIITYLLSCLSIIILRESRLQNYQPHFHVPFYPWVPLIGIIGFVFLLSRLDGRVVLVSAALMSVGGLFVWLYRRVKSNREYALLHLIERITAKELVDRSLESELKEIIRERDDIVEDRFDRIVEEAHIMDLKKATSLEDLFKEVSCVMSPSLEYDRVKLNELLLTREAESSTVMSPFLAIPHIVVEGDHHFSIMLIRSKKGIFFSKNSPCVQAVFVLAGSKDERNFHLRALSAIAQIVQDYHFEKRWMQAKDEEGLRDIILLGKRRRL